MKKPKLGQRIVHEEPTFSRTNEGKVIQLLSAQFVYKTDENELRFCMYKEPWKNSGKKTSVRDK